MRDIVWTIIAIWLVYRIVSAFQAMQARSAKNETRINTDANARHQQKSGKNPLKDEGEYVDYEELS